RAVDDRGQRQVTERSVPVPPLVTLLAKLAPRPRRGVDPRKRRQPVHARKPVTRLAPRLGVEEVIGERPRRRVVEAERPQTLERTPPPRERSKGGLPTPPGRGPRTRAASASTWGVTGGPPSPPASRMRASSGTLPSIGTPSSSASRSPPPEPK